MAPTDPPADTRTADSPPNGAHNGPDQEASSDTAATGSRARHLASAVFVEGSEPLEPGTRYQLAVDGNDLRITGTAHTLPGGRTISRRLRELQMTSTAERLVVAGISPRLADFRLVFDDVRNGPEHELPRNLDSPSAAQDADALEVGR